MNWLALIAGGIGLAVLVAAERETLRHLTTQIIMLVGQPLVVAMQWVARALATLGGFIRDQANEEETAAEETAPAEQSTAAGRPSRLRPHHLSRFVGAVLLTALTLLCGAVETYLTKLSLGPMLGMGGEGDVALVGLLDWMGAAALMAVSVFWGLILVDLYKGTFLLPGHFLRKMRKPLLTVGWGCLALSLAALAVVGVWRGTQVAPVALAAEAEPAGAVDTGSGGPAIAAPVAAAPADEQQPAPFSRFAELFFPTSLSVLTGVTVLFSFTGVVMMFRYLGLAALVALMLPLALLLGPLWLLEQILVALRELKDRAIDLAARPGQWMIATFGPPLSDLRWWAHARIHRALTGEEAAAPPPLGRPPSVVEPAEAPASQSADQRPRAVESGPEQEAVAAQAGESEPEDLDDWNWHWSDRPWGGTPA